MSRPTSEITDRFGHVTRFSDSSSYDEVCVLCGATDAGSDLQRSCPNSTSTEVTEYWVGVNYAFPRYSVQRNFAAEEPTYRWRRWPHEPGEDWKYGHPPADAVHAF